MNAGKMQEFFEKIYKWKYESIEFMGVEFKWSYIETKYKLPYYDVYYDICFSCCLYDIDCHIYISNNWILIQTNSPEYVLMTDGFPEEFYKGIIVEAEYNAYKKKWDIRHICDNFDDFDCYS